MVVLSGLAAQIGLQLLSLVFAVWSTRTGKIVIAASVLSGALWVAATVYLDRAYERGIADSQAEQDVTRREAIAAASAEGEAIREEMERAGAGEEAALRELEARKLKVRNDTKIADRVLLPADDAWLRSKRK